MTTPEGPAGIAWMARNEMRDADLRSTLLSLVEDARAWAGASSPGPGLRSDPPPLPAAVSRTQRAWLDAASPTQLAAHVPALVRNLSSGLGDTEHLSSEPLVDVVVAALTARLRLSPGSPTVLYDPVCGSAGLLLAAAEAVRSPDGKIDLYGKELNPETAYLARTAFDVGGVRGSIAIGNCLTSDNNVPEHFDLAVAEPPYGLHWQHDADAIRASYAEGQYPGGLPPTSDASLLFVQHLIGKMRPAGQGGGRAVILTAAAALRVTGGDDVRQWLLDTDVLEAVIGLPEGISASTGVRLNAMVLTNRKAPARQGKVQLIDLRGAYEDRGIGRLSTRRLRPDALESLTRALSTVKPGPFSRTVDATRFRERNVLVAPIQDKDPRAWRLVLSMADDAESYVGRHVQFPKSSVQSATTTTSCRIDLDEIFARDAGAVNAWVRERGWPVTRLAAVASDISYVPSVSSSDRLAKMAAAGPGLKVMLPIEAGHPAVYDEPVDSAPDRRFIAFNVRAGLQPEFLVSYLNSKNGFLARRSALEPLGSSVSPRTVSRSAVEAILTALVIPVPSVMIQGQLIEADATIHAAMMRATRTADELWRAPDRRAELMRSIARPTEDQTLAEWAQELPYPLAKALWACEAQRGNDHALQRQLFLFWEATAAFTGTVLLSALDQDQTLRETEMASIRATLANQGLSMQRATFGVWLALTQRCSERHYMQHRLNNQANLQADGAEAMRVGGPKRAGI